MRLNVGAKIGGGFVLIILLILLMVGYSYVSLREAKHSLVQIQQANERMALADETTIVYKDAISLIRNYVAYGGEMLAATLGYSPVYLRYNSGRHISHNGRELAAQLETLLAHWPVPVESICVLAHSMGGLLIRSAVHYGRQGAMQWPEFVRQLVFLGTPHHGAPLERVGTQVHHLLAATPFTASFAVLGRLRSAGITDLRYGNVLDEDWQGRNRFDRHADADLRRSLPLPEGIACFTVAASRAGKQSKLADRLIGDGLVPLHSALGQSHQRHHSLRFGKSSRFVVYRTSHIELLSSPVVAQQLVKWLAPPSEGIVEPVSGERSRPSSDLP